MAKTVQAIPGFDRQSGIALLLVLSALAILAAAAIAITTAGQLAMSEAARAKRELQTRQLLESALAYAVLRLQSPMGGQDRFSGETLRIGAQTVLLRVRPEASKVDLNAASETALSQLLAHVTGDRDKALRIAAAAADWRDRDEFARYNGAEASAYRDAGLQARPANGELLSVEEFAGVLGVEPLLLDCLRPYVTVDARTGELAVQDAAPLLKSVFAPDAPGAPPAGPSIIGGATRSGEVYEVAVGLTAPERRHAFTIRLTGEQFHPYRIIASRATGAAQKISNAACGALKNPRRGDWRP